MPNELQRQTFREAEASRKAAAKPKRTRKPKPKAEETGDPEEG